MLINGIDISTLGVKLYDRVLNSNSINTVDDWVDGDIQPTNIRQQEKFKNIQLKFLVLGTDEEDAFFRISKLTQQLKKASVVFDDINLTFDITMYGPAKPERLKNGNFIVSYNFHSDYAKGEREIYTTNANLTNAFKLTVLYYKDTNNLIMSDSITIRASSFTGTNDTLASIGVEVDKYLPEFYNHGVATNLNGIELTYANLQYLNTLIINYNPVVYNLTVNYMMDDGTGFFNDLFEETINFTAPQLTGLQTIGQLIRPQRFKPEGYKSNITFMGDLTVANILSQSPMQVLFQKIDAPTTKNVLLNYYSETDSGEWQPIATQVINVNETQFYDGITLKDIVNISAYRPNPSYFTPGYIVGANGNDLITFEEMEASYDIRYPLAENIVFVEYYLGVYPDWHRITTATIKTKYKTDYENGFELTDIGIDLNRYKTNEYLNGAIYNGGSLATYDDVIGAGVIQVYYEPIDYPITVRFQTEGEQGYNEQTFTINALDFLNSPVLTDLIPIGDYRPEGYQLDTENSYNGEITLQALTQASPITITFEEIEADRTKNVLIHYKQELSNAYSTINTSLITINESDCVGGIRLRDIINLDLYRPEFYDTGLIDGYGAMTLLTFEDIQSAYNVIYNATRYTTPVRYYTDDVDDANWIGSSSISYRVIDFEVSTTLYDLGFNLNAFKPTFCDDGVLQYNGPVNFTALRGLESINVVYDTVAEPGEDDGIDYPHRFLFLQHNDLGNFEGLHPEWTLNHAYINTGVVAQDMSKLTVVMECKRVDENVPLHDVNVGYSYLFGSSSALGAFYMRFNNQTQYGNNLTGVNTYEAKAGYASNQLTITEENGVGWSENSGIYSSARDGYSYATFTYTNPLQTDGAPMSYPLYLFANNNAGSYEGGLAGIGIYGCRIYYDNLLIRDMIPVQFYDKIGDQVAPSNCLYDKITKTFFEDATGMNSFNIIDDDRYEDDNPDHKIGFCYVNYYQNGVRFKTHMYYFRASDFIDKVYNPYDKWQVEENQPPYYKPGVILDFDKIDKSFDGLNNRSFSVNYEEEANQIVVNYYRQDDESADPILIKTENITLKESDFYQVPTFGDIVRLNKYKPSGYKTDFAYTEPKVSLARVVKNSPYNIIYVPETEELIDYTTTVRYIKKVWGIRTYETIGELTLHFDQTMFRDGEYIDYYIDKNAMKPEHYYLDGENFEWYEMDERLATPDALKELYIIKYDCEKQSIPINYYTDEWDEDNLIASNVWNVYLDDFDPEYPFYIVDQLPNSAINQYKPMNCAGGVLQNSNVEMTFETLVALEEIAIVYETIAEPDDPDEAYYERKVLYWGDMCNGLYPSIDEINPALSRGGLVYPYQVPYIDLGYTPKEIGRLRVEITCAMKPVGVNGDGFGGTSIFGYAGMPDFTARIGRAETELIPAEALRSARFNKQNTTHIGSAGFFNISPRMPSTSGAMWIYNYNGPSGIDGQGYSNNVLATTQGSEKLHNIVGYIHPGVIAGFRRGFQFDSDDDYEPIEVFQDHIYRKDFDIRNFPGFKSYIQPTSSIKTDGWMQVNSDRLTSRGIYSFNDNFRPDLQDGTWTENFVALANPFTVVLDAYNNYCSIWNYHDSNYPMTWNIPEDKQSIWEDIERPKGSLSVFTSTNPHTGKPNFIDDVYWDYPIAGLSAITGSYGMAFGKALNGVDFYDAEGPDFTLNYEVDVLVPAGSSVAGGGSIRDEHGVLIGGNETGGGYVLVSQTLSRNVLFINWKTPTVPWNAGGCIWGIKIYDRDRLVRDLIPVSAGDKVYDYVMPETGMFDLITEIFFGNKNPGKIKSLKRGEITYTPAPLYAVPDILLYGKTTTNYYDYDNTYLGNKFVDVPMWFYDYNTTIEDILEWNDYKPDDYHLDGWLDADLDWSFWGTPMSLSAIYEMGTVNVYYKLRTFTKTVVYYQDNCRVGSRDIMYSLKDIRNANTLADLGVDVDLYYDPKFKHGRIVFNETVIADDDIETFINASSPIVVYDKLTRQEAPNLLYIEYYRGGAYDDNLITLDENDSNYLNCDLTARVLNPNGAIKYLNHYHQALYEDENFGEFIPYQVRVLDKYIGLHYGPGRKYKTLAMVVKKDVYTIIQERRGWGRLKEYPNAWILLSATEPITGPGQNPNYDTGYGKALVVSSTSVRLRSSTNASDNENVVALIGGGLEVEILGESIFTGTVEWLPVRYKQHQGFMMAEHLNILSPYVKDATFIPFGDYVNISKMTVDRLWCYAPELESWIKAEDISFNQAGKLYNGLKIEVIDLDEVDFTNADSLDDIGIDIQKWALRFHDRSNFEYTGEYTYEAFSNLHDIEIVYPETIYHYTCLYYHDNVNENNLLGSSGFSCCISDWNPDWDKFIETSWHTEIVPVAGELNRSNDTSTFTYGALYTIDDNDKTHFVRTISSWYGAPIIGPTKTIDNVSYYPVTKDPDGNLVYLKSDRWTSIIKPFGGYETITVNPTLYRDTALTLTWDYFGFDKNLFKPDGYGDGIYLWNSRTWDKDNRIFTFDELIRCGTQYVFYPIFNPDLYKILIAPNNIGAYQPTQYAGSYVYYDNPGINIYLGKANKGQTFCKEEPYDVYCSGEYRNDLKQVLLDEWGISRCEANATSGVSSPVFNNSNIFVVPSSNDITDEETKTQFTRDLNRNGSKYIYNASIYRPYSRYIFGLGNEYDQTENMYYRCYRSNGSLIVDLLQENTNLSVGSGIERKDVNVSSTRTTGIIYDVISYYQFMMIHYWVPVPKGLYYKYNGVDLRIPDNGMFDLLTGDFQTSFKWSNHTTTHPYTSNWQKGSPLSDGKQYIFLRNAPIQRSAEYNLFTDWTYDTTDVQQFKRLTENTKSYVQPDIYATQSRNLQTDLILPITKTTNDAEHKVVGTWDKSCDQWIESEKLESVAGYDSIQTCEKTVSLVPGAHSNFYVYQDPATIETIGQQSNYSYGTGPAVIKVFYSYPSALGNILFDGAHWFPEVYTNLNTEVLNKNYALTKDTTYYTYPWANNDYFAGKYYYGERITVLYTSANNPNWGYTGLGWIELEGNVSEVL